VLSLMALRSVGDMMSKRSSAGRVHRQVGNYTRAADLAAARTALLFKLAGGAILIALILAVISTHSN